MAGLSWGNEMILTVQMIEPNVVNQGADMCEIKGM
jgi:hypothetical protein